FVRATDGDYAANVEAVVTPVPAEIDYSNLPEAKEYDTPDSETIDTLVEWARSEGITIDDREVTAEDTLKCMMVKIAQPGEEPELARVLIPGSCSLVPKRLEAALEPATFELATDADFKDNPFLVKGYVGPRGLTANGVKVYADPRVV